jgi:Pilus formation protein N terminal region
MRRVLFALLALGGSSVLPARAADISVALDQVRTLTFGTPVTTVYVGNPAIADINMIDARHAFILGKGYGSTNIVALNRQGQQISDTRINVLGNQRESTVVLNRGAARVTYACTAQHCEVTPEPGDGKETFDAGNGQTGIHQDIAKKAATAQ